MQQAFPGCWILQKGTSDKRVAFVWGWGGVGERRKQRSSLEFWYGERKKRKGAANKPVKSRVRIGFDGFLRAKNADQGFLSKLPPSPNSFSLFCCTCFILMPPCLPLQQPTDGVRGKLSLRMGRGYRYRYEKSSQMGLTWILVVATLVLRVLYTDSQRPEKIDCC